LQYTGEGSLPRPRLTVGDTSKIISGLVYFYGGIEGAKLTLRSTLKRYLDGQPTADPTAIKAMDSFTVSQRTQEIPGQAIEFELAAPIDFVEESVPARHALPNCPWIYRGAECSYSGAARYTIDNRRTLDPAQDVCAKTLTACTKRFGRNAVLPFGGMPGLRRF
jgi:lambda family phage minor tail protein L